MDWYDWVFITTMIVGYFLVAALLASVYRQLSQRIFKFAYVKCAIATAISVALWSLAMFASVPNFIITLYRGGCIVWWLYVIAPAIAFILSIFAAMLSNRAIEDYREMQRYDERGM